MWNVEKLRKYLKDRGIDIIGDNRKLRFIYYASWLHLQLCSAKSKNKLKLQGEERKSS